MATYPTNFPCPTWEYGEQENTFHRRSPMECGWTRQRKQFPTNQETISLSFKMNTDQLSAWETWIAQQGTAFWTIPLDRYFGAQEDTDIRFITAVTYTYNNFDVITVSVQAEVQP